MKEKEIRKKVKDGVQKEINQKIPEIVKEMDKKTILYILWSLAGMLLISISFPKPVFYGFSFLMMLAAGYFLIGSIKSLKKTLSFIDNFEKEIKKIVKKELESNTEGILGFFKKLLIPDQKSIEDMVIACFVREVVKKFKKYKRYILIRVAAYTIAVLLFKEVLFNIFP